MRASLVFPLAAAAAAAAAAAEAAALFSILEARFSDPELAADDRTLGRCMALSVPNACPSLAFARGELLLLQDL